LSPLASGIALGNGGIGVFDFREEKIALPRQPPLLSFNVKGRGPVSWRRKNPRKTCKRFADRASFQEIVVSCFSTLGLIAKSIIENSKTIPRSQRLKALAMPSGLTTID
jgi:hypothetical protein